MDEVGEPGQIAGAVMQSNGPENVRLELKLESCVVPVNMALSVGLVVNELITNAFKYAYPDGSGGEIRVRLSPLADQRAELVVEDDGVGRTEGAPAKGTGLGSRIVTAMAQSMAGTIAYEARSPGMLARLTFATAEPAPAAAQ